MNPLRPLPRNSTRFGVQAAPSFSPGLKGKKEDEAYFKEGDESAQGDATKDHPLHGKAVHINPAVRGGGKTGTAYKAGSQRGFYQVKRNGAHHGYYHESDLSEKPFGAKHADEPSKGAMFSDGPPHHFKPVLKKHGYKFVGITGGALSTYAHPDGHVAHVLGTHNYAAVSHRHGKTKKETVTNSPNKLHEHLKKIHSK